MKAVHFCLLALLLPSVHQVLALPMNRQYEWDLNDSLLPPASPQDFQHLDLNDPPLPDWNAPYLPQQHSHLPPETGFTAGPPYFSTGSNSESTGKSQPRDLELHHFSHAQRAAHQYKESSSSATPSERELKKTRSWFDAPTKKQVQLLNKTAPWSEGLSFEQYLLYDDFLNQFIKIRGMRSISNNKGRQFRKLKEKIREDIEALPVVDQKGGGEAMRNLAQYYYENPGVSEG
jgi:hypothetical protein